MYKKSNLQENMRNPTKYEILISKFIKNWLPEMILNILGFRMAGQISRRKTKPLNGRENFF